MFASEEDLENASLYEPSSFVGVVFTDSSAMSYRLRFPYHRLPQPSDYIESFGTKYLVLLPLIRLVSPFVDYRCVCFPSADCLSNSVNCRAANYWYSGFIRLQSMIDASIIQVRTVAVQAVG